MDSSLVAYFPSSLVLFMYRMMAVVMALPTNDITSSTHTTASPTIEPDTADKLAGGGDGIAVRHNNHILTVTIITYSSYTRGVEGLRKVRGQDSCAPQKE